MDANKLKHSGHPRQTMQTITNQIQQFNDTFPLKTFPSQTTNQLDSPGKLLVLPSAINVKDGTSYDWESLKWQTWLRIVGFGVQETPSLDWDASPTGSFPCLMVDGEIATGKGIAQLVGRRIDVESASDLYTPVETADLLAFLTLMESTLAYAVTYHFYLIPENFKDVIETLFDERFSYPLSSVLSNSIKTNKMRWLSSRRGVIDRSSIYAEARQALGVLSDRLGSSPHFGGTM
jgi:hypothetical protein